MTKRLNNKNALYFLWNFNNLELWCATMQHCRAKSDITRLFHGSQLHVSSCAGKTTRWPPTEDWQYPFKIWTFPQDTNFQLPGHGLRNLNL